MTNPRVKICDLNKLCNRLLKRINTPPNLNSSFFKPNLFSKSEFILINKSFLLKLSKESFILKLILASESFIEI